MDRWCRGASARRARRGIALALVALAVGLVAGCGALGSPAPDSASPAPSAAPPAIPEASFTGGPASARLDAPGAVAWEGGYCERGPDEAWLALNVGFPNGSEYFGLVVGQSPLTPAATRGAAGGGTLGGNDVVITWRHGGVAVNVERGGLVLELAKDLSIGTFSGRLRDGTEVRGTFACGG